MRDMRHAARSMSPRGASTTLSVTVVEHVELCLVLWPERVAIDLARKFHGVTVEVRVHSRMQQVQDYEILEF